MRSFLFFLLLSSGTVQAQLPRTTTSIALTKVVQIKEIRGRNFNISVDVKSKPSDKLGALAVSVLQVGRSDWDFIKKNNAYAMAAADTGWQQLTISGSIDSTADKLWIYMCTSGNGDFYFDNIRVKAGPEDQDIKVPNGDFEQSRPGHPLKDLENSGSAMNVKGSAFSIERDVSYGQVLHIHSEGGMPDTVIYYGYNRSAGKFIRSDSSRIYYEVYGAGEPLLLLHGNGGSISSFSKVIPELSRKYKVIAVDTRGQGNSPDSGPQRFTYELFAEDMKNLLDTLGLKNVCVAGWSDGGITGLLLASKYPDYVGKLVTMGANLNPADTSVSRKILARGRKDLQRLQDRKNPEDSTTIKLLHLILEEPHIAPAVLENIKAKTLIMAGEKDLVLEPHTRLIAGSIPGAQLKILKGATHWVVTEDPELFCKEILRFLDE